MNIFGVLVLVVTFTSCNQKSSSESQPSDPWSQLGAKFEGRHLVVSTASHKLCTIYSNETNRCRTRWLQNGQRVETTGTCSTQTTQQYLALNCQQADGKSCGPSAGALLVNLNSSETIQASATQFQDRTDTQRFIAVKEGAYCDSLFYSEFPTTSNSGNSFSWNAPGGALTGTNEVSRSLLRTWMNKWVVVRDPAGQVNGCFIFSTENSCRGYTGIVNQPSSLRPLPEQSCGLATISTTVNATVSVTGDSRLPSLARAFFSGGSDRVLQGNELTLSRPGMNSFTVEAVCPLGK